MWIDKVANVYFHLNTKCLKKFDPNLKLEEITMNDEMFYKMTDRHLKLLAEVGVLKHIIANKGLQVEQVSIYLFIYLFILRRLVPCHLRVIHHEKTSSFVPVLFNATHRNIDV